MMFRNGSIDGVIIISLDRHVDNRGFLVECYRSDTLPEGLKPVMSYLSVTKPGVARGPHEHTDQTDVFVFLGPGNFCIHLWDKRAKSSTSGNRMVIVGGEDNPVTMIVPPGIVHGYRNISPSEQGVVLNFPDRLYAGWGKQDSIDEIRHEVDGDPYYEDFLKT